MDSDGVTLDSVWPTELRTDRLHLRPVTHEDAPLVGQLLTDGRVRVHLGGFVRIKVGVSEEGDSGWHPGAMRPGTDATENSLRHLLNEWDPIGVADEVQDEYDCMLVPLLQRLRGGADQTEIGEFLRHELEDHFGLTPLPSEPEAMAARVISWWTAASKADGVRGV